MEDPPAPVQSKVRIRWHARRSRRAAWLVLSLPLAVYVLVFPVDARLDQGEIERRLGASIWRTMANSLPEVEVPIVFQTAFWIAALVFILGALWLIWLALDGTRLEPAPFPDQSVFEPVDAGHGLAVDEPA